MRHAAGSPVTRRDFVHIGAAGAACLGVPSIGLSKAGWLNGISRTASPLDVAAAAGRWLEANEVGTARGITWPRVPGQDPGGDVGLYHGVPGVILFLLELHHATGDDAPLESAAGGARELASRLSDGQPIAPGLYTGLAGMAYALQTAADVSGDRTLSTAARTCIDRIIEASRPAGAGVTWYEDEPANASSDIVSGAAGIGFTLLWYGETHRHDRAIETAISAASHLETLGQPASDGRKWAMMPSFERLMPNFSHGTAGVAAFLARAAAAAGDRILLDAAIDGARYLETVGVCDRDGCRVFHHEPEGEDLFYLSWCHGPAGTARLFYQLAESTDDASWNDWLAKGAGAIRAFGVPETRSPGYWNNISQCCGDAGVGEFFLALHAMTGSGDDLAMARRIAEYIQERSDSPDEAVQSWTQAEHRVRPELLEAQTGWMQGAAGVGAFFLHLDARQRGESPLVALPDATWRTAL